jgi:hypothetical protein
MLILGALTYSKIENYRNTLVLQAEFINYMKGSERSFQNKVAESLFEDTEASHHASSGEKKSKPKLNSSPRLSLLMFMDSKRKSQFA